MKPTEHAAALVPRFSSRSAYQEAVTQLEPWLPLVDSAARRHGVELLERPRVSSSWRNPTLFLPPGHYLKLYLDQADGLESDDPLADEIGSAEPGLGYETRMGRQEMLAYSLVSRVPDLAVPRLVGSGWMGDDCCYVLLERLPGRMLADERPSLDRPQRQQMLRDAGALLRQIHSVPLSLEEREAGRMQFREELGRPEVRAETARELEQLLPDRLMDQLDSWLPGIDAQAGSVGDMVLIHGNFSYWHLFADTTPKQPRLSGVIDLGSSRIGHPLYDLPAIWRNLIAEPQEDRMLLLQASRLPERAGGSFPRRALEWSLRRPAVSSSYLSEHVGDAQSLDDLARRVFGSA